MRCLCMHIAPECSQCGKKPTRVKGFLNLAEGQHEPRRGELRGRRGGAQGRGKKFDVCTLDKWRLLVSSSLNRAPSDGQEVWFHDQSGELFVACEVAVVVAMVVVVVMLSASPLFVCLLDMAGMA